MTYTTIVSSNVKQYALCGMCQAAAVKDRLHLVAVERLLIITVFFLYLMPR
jgi:hypothetical protein